MAKSKQKIKGSIYQNRLGKWVAIFNAGNDDFGKRKRKQVYYGDSKEEAQAALQNQNIKANEKYKALHSKKFNDIFNNWLLNVKRYTVKSHTFDNIMRYSKNHILPYFKHFDIIDADVAVAQSFLKNVESLEARRKCKYILNQFYNYSVVHKYIEYNPILSIDVRGFNDDIYDRQEKYKAIKPEYRQQFFNALDNDVFLKSLCLTGILSGLRIGELLGLRWQDIDFENKILNVQHAVVLQVEYDEDGNRIGAHSVLSEPKTRSSKAKLPMSSPLVAILQEWKKYREDNSRGKKLTITNNESFVFGNSRGYMLSYNYVNDRFQKFLKDNNLKNKGIHFHALRHTFGDMLRSKNWSIYDIQKMLRHSKASTTEIYLSMKKDPALDLQNRIDNAFDDFQNSNLDKPNESITEDLRNNTFESSNNENQFEDLDEYVKNYKNDKRKRKQKDFEM